MKTNIKQKQYTHEGAVASNISTIEQLRRSVMACMLWEKTFYEDGVSVVERIKSLVESCNPEEVVSIAIEARNAMRLRHAPLLLMRELARHPKNPKISDGLCEVIQRADELAEFLSLYWQDGKQPLSKQVKKGLACAFTKFNAYQLAKYNRDGIVKLRDVLFMVHAKPKDKEQEEVWKKLVDGKLETPDTWEVALSSGDDKKLVFERLLGENKLGYMALLRNLRNMKQANVDTSLIFERLLSGAVKSKALPFRYLAAARVVPEWEDKLEQAMFASCENMTKLTGKTVLLVDVSYSMHGKLSEKSDLNRIDAACALAVLIRELCNDVLIVSFSNEVIIVPPRRGFALIDAINNSQMHSGTYLGDAVIKIKESVKDADRIIVITDEQSRDKVPDHGFKNGYMINVSTNQNGVGYGQWTHIHGFSEQIVNYIQAFESE